MCVTNLPLFAILLSVISHSFGSPVAHEYRRDTGVVLMRADNPDPVFHTSLHHPMKAMLWDGGDFEISGSGVGMSS